MSVQPTGWRPRHDDPLMIMAMDHRGSFATLFGVADNEPTAEQLRRMRRAKELIYFGLRQARPSVASGRVGVLVDEDYGSTVISSATKDDTVLAVPIEASGQEWFSPEFGDEWLEHLRAIDPAYAKVLVRDHPDLPATDRHAQLSRLADVSQRLEQARIPLLYELLVPASDDDLRRVGGDKDRYDRELRAALVIRVIEDNHAAGVEPAVWKVEGLETVADARLVADAARAGRRDVDLVVLGRDAPEERLRHWLSVARDVDAFVGFAIGRSIWEETARRWTADAVSDDAAVDDIARRYLVFVDAWLGG